MTEPTTTIGAGPPGLLAAMLAMIQSKGVSAAQVTGYRERSYNIGYCGTCSEMTSDVRIYYRSTSGADAYYQAPFTDLGELIRELTKDDAKRQAWDATALRESEDERDERYGVHNFDEEAEGA